MVEPPSRITALSTVDNAAIVQIKEERMAVFPVDLLMLALRFFPWAASKVKCNTCLV